MKKVPKPVFFIVALLILAFAYTAVFGIAYYNGDNKVTVIKGISDIRWGIDISGGVNATFKPADNYDASKEELKAASETIKQRMQMSGINDYEIYDDEKNDKIIVRFPWKADEKEYNAAEAVEEISATAKLTFRPDKNYADTKVDKSGNVLPITPTNPNASTGTEDTRTDEEKLNEALTTATTDTTIVLMDGSMVKDAKPRYGNLSQGGLAEHYVELTLTDEGKDRFAQITKTYLNKVVSIWMDDVMISYPTINSEITDGVAVISGSFTAKSAAELANKIKAGALPFSLETVTYGNISPTLGQNALLAMGWAGGIAFLLIAVLMIVFYRLPGVIAVISLTGQMALSIAAISRYFPIFSSFTMTLPGIAGLILSIGMGVDCNVITAERIKEELRGGRTLDGALEKGTKNSLAAIIDGNMTVVIVSIILMLVFGPSNILSFIFGESTTGTIYSFGYTLLVGVISNFIMGIFFSRLMLRSIAGIKPFRNTWLYGGAKNGK